MEHFDTRPCLAYQTFDCYNNYDFWMILAKFSFIYVTNSNSKEHCQLEQITKLLLLIIFGLPDATLLGTTVDETDVTMLGITDVIVADVNDITVADLDVTDVATVDIPDFTVADTDVASTQTSEIIIKIYK